MADDLENSGQWRQRVETRLSTLEARVEQEAGLRAAMDKDLSGVRVERKVLQALHDTQSEHTAQLRELRDTQSEHTAQLKELREGQQKVIVGVELINGKLDRLIADDKTTSS